MFPTIRKETIFSSHTYLRRPHDAHASVMFGVSAYCPLSVSKLLPHHPLEHVWRWRLGRGQGRYQFRFLGCLALASGRQRLRRGGSQGEAGRHVSPGFAGRAAPRGPDSRSTGTLSLGASLSRTQKQDMPRGQEQPGSSPLDSEPLVSRGLPHTHVTGVCVCVYGGGADPEIIRL